MSLINVLIAMIMTWYDFFSITSDQTPWKSSYLLSCMMLYFVAVCYTAYSFDMILVSLIAACISIILFIAGFLQWMSRKLLFWWVVLFIWSIVYLNFFKSDTLEKLQSVSCNIFSIWCKTNEDLSIYQSWFLADDTISSWLVWVSWMQYNIVSTGEINVTSWNDTIIETQKVETWTLLSSWDSIATIKPDQELNKISKNLFSVSRTVIPVTYANFLPLLQKKYKLVPKGNVNFTYVTNKNPLYSSFVTAFNKWIIGIDVNPTMQLKCKYIMTFIWLIEAPSLKNNSVNIHATYREYAKNRWYLQNGCNQKDAIATFASLP